MKANLFVLPKLILNPGGKLTLNIFEKRYLNLLDSCLKNKVPMAIGHGVTEPSLSNEEIEVPHESFKHLFEEVGFGHPEVIGETPSGSKVIVINGLGKGRVSDCYLNDQGFIEVNLNEIAYYDQLNAEKTFLYRRLKVLAREKVLGLLNNEREADILMNNLSTPNELVAFYSDYLLKDFDNKLEVFKQNDINGKIQLLGQFLVA